jgi:hypothetical protein
MEDFTPRTVAKYVATTAIKMKTVQLAKEALADHTRFEEDDIVVRIGANVIGWGIAFKLKPYTDMAIDKTADFVNDRREAQKADQKDTTPEEK